MSSAPWTVAAAGWLAIVAGAVLAILAVVVFVTVTRGSPVVAGGPILFGLVAGSVSSIVGVALIVCGIKLMEGHSWARTVLELIAWTTLAVSAGWVIYDFEQMSEIRTENAVPEILGFLAGGVPAALMILLLHSGGVERALQR
jgi:hypothetical protein